MHWVQDGDDVPEVAFWETADAPTWTPEGARCMWRLHDETQQYAPDAPQLSGYRYLGPATGPRAVAARGSSYPEPFVDGLKERIATLETECEALRVEKRYMLARMDEWRVGLPSAPPYQRAHDLGWGRRL